MGQAMMMAESWILQKMSDEYWLTSYFRVMMDEKGAK